MVMRQGSDGSGGLQKREGRVIAKHTELEDSVILFDDFMGKLKDSGFVFDEKKHRILEIGAGKGKLFRHLKDEGYMIEAIDAKPPPDADPEVRKGMPESLPFENGRFRVVFGIKVFDATFYLDQTPEKQKAMLREIMRVLESDGALRADREMERFAGMEAHGVTLDLIERPRGERSAPDEWAGVLNGVVLRKYPE